MKKILSIVASIATLFAIASCNGKPSAEEVQAEAVKNATDLVEAFAANNTDGITAALNADVAAFAKLGISEEKTPDLVKVYNDSYENTLEDWGITKDQVIDQLKKRGIEIPVAPKPEVKDETEEEPEEEIIEVPADSAGTDLDVLKEAAEEAADKAIDAIGDYSAKIEKEEEVIEAPIPEAVPYILVEEKPTFNGGNANDFTKYINSNITYPQEAQDRGAEGRVVINFKVGTDGQIKDVVLVKGVDPAIDAEALRVIKNAPAWTPGKQNGEPVEVSYTCPVIFKIQ